MRLLKVAVVKALNSVTRIRVDSRNDYAIFLGTFFHISA